MEKEKKVEQQNIDPELEYEIAEANETHKAEREKQGGTDAVEPDKK